MKRLVLFVVLLMCLLFPVGSPQAAPGGARVVRDTIEHYFQLLKTGRYEKIYDLLPASTRSLSSRQDFASGLSRLAGLLRFEKIEIGRIDQKGTLAVAATTVYGTLSQPITLNDRVISRGRIVSQHYLVKENGSWKVASVNEQTLRLFLKEHPSAWTLFPQYTTRFELLSEGQWVRMPGSR